jgi:hypothetical protein
MTPEQRECARLRANAMADVTGSCRDGPRNGRGSRKGSAGRFCRGDARRRESGRNGGNILPPRRLRPRVASLLAEAARLNAVMEGIIAEIATLRF